MVRNRIKNLKTRIMAVMLTAAMAVTLFSGIPEKVKGASGVRLNEGEIYTFADCEWMAVEVHDEYTTLQMTKGNTDHGDMCGAWPGYIKNVNSGSDQNMEYENISSYYPGLSYLYSQIGDKEYADANGEGLYLVSKDDITNDSKYISAFNEAIHNQDTFGSSSEYVWLGTVGSNGYAWRFGYNGYLDERCTQDVSLVVAPAFNIDTSLLSASEIRSIFPESVTVNGTTINTTELSAIETGSFYGLHYKIYDNGLCVMVGNTHCSAISYPWCSSSVTQIYADFTSDNLSGMFQNASNLEYIEFGDNFSTAGSNKFDNMFYGCSKIKSIDLGKINMDSATQIYNMFKDCTSLSSIDLSGNNLSSVTNIADLFGNCTNLSYVNLSGVDLSSVNCAIRMFSGCTNLTSIDLSSLSGAPLSNTSYMFENCPKLNKIWLPSTITTISNDTFSASLSVPGMGEENIPLTTTATVFTDASQKNDGWNISKEDENRVFTNQTIYGATKQQFESASLHTITFKDSDNIEISETEIVTGRDLTAPADPTRTGYTFYGWSEDGTNVITLPAKATEDRTYTAVYTPNTYTIKYNANGGTGEMEDTSATYDADTTLRTSTFVNTGSAITGWALTSDGEVAYKDGDTVKNLTAEADGAITLYAVWKKNPENPAGGNTGTEGGSSESGNTGSSSAGNNSGSSAGSGSTSTSGGNGASGSSSGGSSSSSSGNTETTEKPEEKPVETNPSIVKHEDGSTITTTTSTNSVGEILKEIVYKDKNGKVTQIVKSITHTDLSTRTDTTAYVQGTEIIVTVERDSLGKPGEITEHVNVPVQGSIKTNGTTVRMGGAVVQKMYELTMQADVDVTVSCVKEEKDTWTSYADVTVPLSLLKRGQKVNIMRKVGDTLCLTAAKSSSIGVGGAVTLSKLTPGVSYRLVESSVYKTRRDAIYKSVRLAKTSVSIKKGKSAKVTLVSGYNKASIKSISYKTSNKKVVTVSKTGKITGKKQGTATVSAIITFADGHTKTLKMKVRVK